MVFLDQIHSWTMKSMVIIDLGYVGLFDTMTTMDVHGFSLFFMFFLDQIHSWTMKSMVIIDQIHSETMKTMVIMNQIHPETMKTMVIRSDPLWDHENHANHVKTKVGRVHFDVQIHLLIEENHDFYISCASGTHV